MKHRILATFAACAVTVASCAAANAQAPSAGHQRAATLTVTGEGTITRAPDRATISFRIETNNDVAATATSANSALAGALQKRLAALNIPAGAISTSNYGLNYTPHPPKPDPASTQRFGFTVERTIDVAIDNVDGAGAVVDAGVAAGVTNVNGVSYSLRDQHATVRAAQTAALADAVLQARSLAAAANVRLVRILVISPSGSSGPIRPHARMLMAVPAGVPTTLDPGNLSVTANVTLQYEVAPARP